MRVFLETRQPVGVVVQNGFCAVEECPFFSVDGTNVFLVGFALCAFRVINIDVRYLETLLRQLVPFDTDLFGSYITELSSTLCGISTMWMKSQTLIKNDIRYWYAFVFLAKLLSLDYIETLTHYTDETKPTTQRAKYVVIEITGIDKDVLHKPPMRDSPYQCVVYIATNPHLLVDEYSEIQSAYKIGNQLETHYDELRNKNMLSSIERAKRTNKRRLPTIPEPSTGLKKTKETTQQHVPSISKEDSNLGVESTKTAAHQTPLLGTDLKLQNTEQTSEQLESDAIISSWGNDEE